MSHNLVCDEVELLQTPTWVTEMCLSYDPKYKSCDGGWQGVLRRYTIWVKSHYQTGSFKGKKDHEETKAFYNEHIESLQKAIKKKGFLTFSSN